MGEEMEAFRQSLKEALPNHEEAGEPFLPAYHVNGEFDTASQPDLRHYVRLMIFQLVDMATGEVVSRHAEGIFARNAAQERHERGEATKLKMDIVYCYVRRDQLATLYP